MRLAFSSPQFGQRRGSSVSASLPSSLGLAPDSLSATSVEPLEGCHEVVHGGNVRQGVLLISRFLELADADVADEQLPAVHEDVGRLRGHHVAEHMEGATVLGVSK